MRSVAAILLMLSLGACVGKPSLDDAPLSDSNFELEEFFLFHELMSCTHQAFLYPLYLNPY